MINEGNLQDYAEALTYKFVDLVFPKEIITTPAIEIAAPISWYSSGNTPKYKYAATNTKTFLVDLTIDAFDASMYLSEV